MKIYHIGVFTVRDSEIQSTKEEILTDLLYRMSKYDTEGFMTYNDNNLTLEQKLTKITLLRYQFGGLAEFLGNTLKIDVRTEDGTPFTQPFFTHFHYWCQMLEIELSQKKRKEKVNGNE